jgi:hypothetical protein
MISGCQKPASHNPQPPDSIQDLGQTIEISPSGVVREMLEEVELDRALRDLRRLSGEAPICVGSGCYTIANRLTGSEGLRWAMEYIYEELGNLGYAVEFRNWSRSGRSDRNLVARKLGAYAPSEEVCFVAHVDGVKTGAGQRFPAADDDASGVVGVLEMARILSSQQFSRTVVLLFTTGEEQGALGVRSYLDQLSPAELGSIQVAVDVDMVGYDGNHDGAMELWHGGHMPSLVVTQMMSDTIKAYHIGLAPTFVAGCG